MCYNMFGARAAHFKCFIRVFERLLASGNGFRGNFGALVTMGIGRGAQVVYLFEQMNIALVL